MVTIGWALSWGEWFQFAADPPWTIVSPVLICHFLLPLCCQFFYGRKLYFVLISQQNWENKGKESCLTLDLLHSLVVGPWWDLWSLWGLPPQFRQLCMRACACVCARVCVSMHVCFEDSQLVASNFWQAHLETQTNSQWLFLFIYFNMM